MRLHQLFGLLILTVGATTLRADLINFPAEESFLPSNWVADPIRAQITPINPKLQAIATEILTNALSKYPETLTKKFLNGVFVVGSLRFFDVAYGGTYLANGKQIVLVYRETFDPRGFEQRFHHEFSSILLKQNEKTFDTKRWLKGNEPTFVYRAPGVIEKQSGGRSEATKALEMAQKETGGSGSDLLHLDSGLMDQGFLTAYNMISVEQDLNETAAHLFTNPELWNYCARHPRLDQKVDVLIDFYRNLDPVFDRIYFREVSLREPHKHRLIP